ncbi:MAG: trypsin-like peptidase domain-containing protein, partial [Dehalococcoidia bacterium]|nr:trypsin-like peptidase domain-containing protein [Dehalococcoidia bacterium]
EPTRAPSSSVAAPQPVSIPDIVDQAKPAVVGIHTEGTQLNMFLQPVPSRGVGSGVIITSDGYVLTNNHVVEGTQNITVDLPRSGYFPQGTSFESTVVGRDPLTDLAIVKVDAQDLPFIPIGDTAKLRVGEWVIAIGNAQGLPGGPTVTLGIVSAMGRSVETGDRDITMHDLVQTDAAINPGNSGGPLLNLAGEVVGINTAIIRGAQNIGFSISTATVNAVMEDLIQGGKVKWPWLGVRITTVTPALAKERGYSVEQGVLVIEVLEGFPASKAGLLNDDIMVSLDGEFTPDLETFKRMMRLYRAGDTVEVAVVRDSKEVKMNITLGEKPAL